MDSPVTNLSPDQPPKTGISAPIISLQQVEKTFPARGKNASVVALNSVDLDVPKGAIVGVIGKSGAGKSTLIRLVNGLEQPSSGRVLVDGVEISALPEAKLRQERRSIGMIFQHFNLLARRTAFDNVALPLEIAGISRSEIKQRVSPLLDLVGLGDKASRYPGELSGGQKQRVGIARALATNPKVLLSDEATSALDPETTEQILDLLRKINADLQVTVLLITHEMSVIKSVASRVAVIDGGSIVEEGETYDVFTRPQHTTTKNFVASITGTALPPQFASRLSGSALPCRQALVQLTFQGEGAAQPFLSILTRRLGVDFGIVQAKVDHIGGKPFGTLVVTVPQQPETISELLSTAQELGLTAEVLGYA